VVAHRAGRFCGNPNVLNFALSFGAVQVLFFFLRSAFSFQMKIKETLSPRFFLDTSYANLHSGLLRWCSNQSPGPEAVP
jgi:hypothetical protein